MLAMRTWENHFNFFKLEFFRMKIRGVEELQELNEISVDYIL